MKILATLATLRTLNLRNAKRLFGVLERKPYIEISQFGWKTDRPQLVVGMNSTRGMTTIMATLDDDAGNARCSMHAKTLAGITGFRVLDRRAIATNEADRGFNDFVAAPRDAVPVEQPAPKRSHLGAFRIFGSLTAA